jgi:hypothetical protein
MSYIQEIYTYYKILPVIFICSLGHFQLGHSLPKDVFNLEHFPVWMFGAKDALLLGRSVVGRFLVVTFCSWNVL